MKKHLNTLYVLTQGSHVAKENETLVVKVGEEIRMRLPILTLESVVCFGQVSMSPWAMGFCSERGVRVAFLTENGRFQARVEGPTTGNVLLRREQYRRADDEARSLAVARQIVLAKILNCRTVLLRSARDRPGTEASDRLSAAAERIRRLGESLGLIENVASLRGLEGMAAKEYFGAFDDLISQQKEDFRFTVRSRRPPLDRINALLSFLYTLLVHDARSALESVGLDPAVGYLHEDRPGRPGLALDLVEELRPWFADRLALSLVNLRQLGSTDFRLTESGAVLLTDDARKTVLTAYQKRKQDELLHPFLDEKTTVGMVAHLQALLLARHLRCDLEAYPPFVWK